MSITNKFFSFFISGLLLLGGGACALKVPTRSLEQIRESTAKVVVLDEYGNARGSGTGFIVSIPGSHDIDILTVRHVCVPGMKIDTPYVKELTPPAPNFRVEFPNGNYRAEIKKIDMHSDLCLLKLTDNRENNTELHLSHNYPQLGDSISVIGYPHGFGPLLSLGHFNETSGGGIGPEELFSILTIHIFPGNSGSGVFNDRGQLVGVISWSMVGVDTLTGAVPLQEIERFLEDV